MIDPAALAEALFAHAPVACAIFAIDGGLVRANDAYARSFGGERVAQPGIEDLLRRARRGEVVRAPLALRSLRAAREAEAQTRPTAIECTLIPLADEHVLVVYLDVSAEREARTQLERLRSLFAQTPASIAYLHGPDHVVEVANVRLLARRKLVGRPIREAIPELEESGLFDMYDRAYATGEPATCPAARIASEETGERWYRVACQPTRGANGEVEGILVLGVDVTDEVLARRREQALTETIRRSEERYRSLVEASTQIIWTATPSGRCVDGRSWSKFTGLPAGACEGFGWLDSVHPEDRAATLDTWDHAMRSAEPFATCYRVRRADGRYRYMQVRAAPVREADGSLREWVGVHRDVTEEMRARASAVLLSLSSRVVAQSLHAEPIAESLVELAAEGFATYAYVETLDEHGAPRRIASAHRDPAKTPWVRESPRLPRDPAALDAIGRGDRAWLLRELDARDRLSSRSAIVVPLRSRETYFGLMTLVRSSPEEDFDDTDLVTTEDLAGRVAAALENAKLYREAQDAIRIRDAFLAIASHELKTPLTALTLELEAQRRGREVSAASMLRQVKRLTDLVDSLLDVTRIRGGELELDLHEIDLSTVVRELGARYLSEAARAGCTLRVEADVPILGRWDRPRIEQIVSSLLSNALKYGPGKPVTVRTEALGDRARIVVCDEGIGIAPAALARIFERFERAVSHHQYGGLGLGLYLARRIVEAMGGTISARSEEGRGATFVVELPIRR